MAPCAHKVIVLGETLADALAHIELLGLDPRQASAASLLSSCRGRTARAVVFTPNAVAAPDRLGRVFEEVMACTIGHDSGRCRD